MATDTYVMGVFDSEERTVAVVRDLKQSPWSLKKVHSPVPSHRLTEALGLKKSSAGWFTLCGGIIGFFTGYGLAIFTAMRWELIISGKPVVAMIPFLIVGFEFTILFAIFGNLIGFLHLSRLPRLQNLAHYDERLSGEYFGVLAACARDQREGLAELFRKYEGDVRVFEPST